METWFFIFYKTDDTGAIGTTVTRTKAIIVSSKNLPCWHGKCRFVIDMALLKH